MAEKPHSHRQELTKKILGYLNENTPYAVLRNYEQLPLHNPGRDIDIIIHRSDFKRIRKTLVGIINDSGWNIVNYLYSDRLVTYVCGKIDGDKVELIQWDFFFHTSVFGILLIDAGEFLKDRVFNGEVYHVSKAYEFLDKFLYVRAVGQSYPERYQEIKETVRNNPAVTDKLKSVFSDGAIENIERMPGKKVLKRAFLSGLKKHPFRQTGRIFFFAFTYVKNYLLSRTGCTVGFTGPDGAGKTTVIESLHRQLSPVFGKASVYFHFRPALLPNLGEAAHRAGIKKEVDREYEKPHRGEKKGILNSFLRLCYYTADYLIGYWVKVKPHKRITRFIVFDRYYTDIIADSRRSCVYLPAKFLYHWGKIFVPALNYNILLTADTDMILKRKQELDREGIETIHSKLDYLSAKKGYDLIRNNHTPEEAVIEILTVVFGRQHKKNLKRMGCRES